MGKLSNILSRLLNIGPSEAPHVLISWSLGLFSRISYVIGWTILIVFFVSHFGINSLPLLFVFHAGGIILGTILFGELVNRVKKEQLLLSLIMISSLLLSLGAYVTDQSQYLFLTIVFVCLSVLLSQFKIIHTLFVEELFTPTQSNRVFPIIESAETFGLIIGGILISSLAPILPVHKFLYVWLIVFVIGIPSLIFYLSHSISIPFTELIKPEEEKHASRLGGLIQGFKEARKIKFLQSLVLIVLLQWMFFSILEFQYTKAIEQSITHTQEDTLLVQEYNEFGKASVLIAQDTESPYEEEASNEPIIVRGETFQRDLATDLGLLQILFGVATLFFQLFLASRIMSYLGVVKSMLLYPIVLVISVLWMMISFGFGSALLARFNHEVTHSLHNNAYHASYYALSHNMRANVKEFMEGFARPVGAIFGTILLFAATKLWSGMSLTIVLNALSLGILFMMMYATSQLQKHYRDLPRNELMNSNSLNALVNALKIMEQNGSAEDADFLVHLHSHRHDLAENVQGLVIETIGAIGEARHIPYLIDLIQSRQDLRKVSLRAINSIFSKDYDDVSSKPFTWYALRKLYQELLSNNSDPELKGDLMSFIILTNYHEGFVDDVIGFIEENLDAQTIAVCSGVLKEINDHHVVSYVSNFLDHDDPSVRASIIDVIWNFVPNREDINGRLRVMLGSDTAAEVIEALVVIAKLRESAMFEESIRAVGHSTNTIIQFLVKANLYELGGKQEFINFLYDEIEFDHLEELGILVDKIDHPLISKQFRKRVASELHNMYMNLYDVAGPEAAVESIQTVLLERLYSLYKILGANKELFIIEEILRS